LRTLSPLSNNTYFENSNNNNNNNQRNNNKNIMGMVICTFVTCPIGSCIGCVTAACCAAGHRDDDQARAKRRLLLTLFATILAAGCICYVALTIGCAKADNDRWTLFRGEGECWSEGGSMPYGGLGWWTGALLGVGFFGTVILLDRMRRDWKMERNHEHENFQQMEEEKEAEPIV